MVVCRLERPNASSFPLGKDKTVTSQPLPELFQKRNKQARSRTAKEKIIHRLITFSVGFMAIGWLVVMWRECAGQPAHRHRRVVAGIFGLLLIPACNLEL